ncbi:MAG: hypothetical protein NVS3B20_03330 [Polyangiales bacterium]
MVNDALRASLDTRCRETFEALFGYSWEKFPIKIVPTPDADLEAAFILHDLQEVYARADAFARKTSSAKQRAIAIGLTARNLNALHRNTECVAVQTPAYSVEAKVDELMVELDLALKETGGWRAEFLQKWIG